MTVKKKTQAPAAPTTTVAVALVEPTPGRGTSATHVIPMSIEEDSLVLVQRVGDLLARAVTIETAKEVKDLALTVEDWLRRKGASADAIQTARAYYLEAERRLGELLKKTKRHPGGRGTGNRSPHGTSFPPKLSDLGISKKESARAQRIADLPQEIFEAIRDGTQPISSLETPGGEVTINADNTLLPSMGGAAEAWWSSCYTPERLLTDLMQDMSVFAKGGPLMRMLGRLREIGGVCSPAFQTELERALLTVRDENRRRSGRGGAHGDQNGRGGFTGAPADRRSGVSPSARGGGPGPPDEAKTRGAPAQEEDREERAVTNEH